MVVHDDEGSAVDRIFGALADGTRRDIVHRAMGGEQSVSDLARHYSMTFAAVQKHVAVLERAALVTKERRGRQQIVRVDMRTIRSARELLDAYESLWRERSARISAILADDASGAGSEPGPAETNRPWRTPRSGHERREQQ